MIITKEIKIKKTNNLTNEYIEKELNLISIEPLRWAIVDIDEHNYIISASFEE